VLIKHPHKFIIILHALDYIVANVANTDAPYDSGYTKIYSTGYAFAALRVDGSITAWGNSHYGGAGAPYGEGYTKKFIDFMVIISHQFLIIFLMQGVLSIRPKGYCCQSLFLADKSH
jgi:hypothetical protein